MRPLRHAPMLAAGRAKVREPKKKKSLFQEALELLTRLLEGLLTHGASRVRFGTAADGASWARLPICSASTSHENNL